VDATADSNIIVLSVGTSQFKGYMNRGDDESEVHDPKTDQDLPPLYTPKLEPPSLSLASYPDPSSKETSKEPKRSKIKNTSLMKRKSIFQMRKESRENALSDKSTA
jgi:hypothetical protein